MAQLRQDYETFRALDTEIIVIGPEKAEQFCAYFAKEKLPFIGLSDPEHRVEDLYGQEVRLLKLGRLPAMMLIDKSGTVRFAHYGDSMKDIPENAEIIHLIESQMSH